MCFKFACVSTCFKSADGALVFLFLSNPWSFHYLSRFLHSLFRAVLTAALVCRSGGTEGWGGVVIRPVVCLIRISALCLARSSCEHTFKMCILLECFHFKLF